MRVAGGHRARFSLLESVKAYAEQRLVDAGEAGAARDRHLGSFGALARQRGVSGFSELRLGIGLRADRGNLTAAFEWTAGQVRWVLGSETYYHHGQAQVQLNPATARPNWSYGRLGRGHVYAQSPAPQNVWNRMGFAAWHDGWMSSFADSHRRVWAMPAWGLATIFALPPAFWMLRRIRRSRRYKGRCPKCGYDLRGQQEQRCPECGFHYDPEALSDLRNQAAFYILSLYLAGC